MRWRGCDALLPMLSTHLHSWVRRSFRSLAQERRVQQPAATVELRCFFCVVNFGRWWHKPGVQSAPPQQRALRGDQTCAVRAPRAPWAAVRACHVAHRPRVMLIAKTSVSKLPLRGARRSAQQCLHNAHHDVWMRVMLATGRSGACRAEQRRRDAPRVQACDAIARPGQHGSPAART